MRKLHPAVAAATIAATFAGVLWRSGYSTYGPIDTGILALFLIFFWWLISDFSGGKVGGDVDGRHSANDGIAFRFGRFLGRVFGRGNSRL